MRGLTFDDINIIPKYSKVQHRDNVDIKSRLVGDITIDNPIIPANMDTIAGKQMMFSADKNGSFCFLHRFMSMDERLKNIQDMLHIWSNVKKVNVSHDALFGNDKPDWFDTQPIGISIGVNGDELTFLQMLHEIERLESMKYIFLIDVAHGHHVKVKNMLANVKGMFPNDYVIAGNVATFDGAYDLCNWGADGIKVGIGSGSLCETRIRTGVGIPQATAIIECRRALNDWALTLPPGKWVPTLIADGGIKMPGDIVKALALGADTCMSGYLFAGTDETPGEVGRVGIYPNERRVKQYRGSASRSSKSDRGETSHIEGNIKTIPIKGPVKYIFDSVRDGIKSGFSYVGAEDFDDFVKNVEVMKVSQNSVLEAHPNLLYKD